MQVQTLADIAKEVEADEVFQNVAKSAGTMVRMLLLAPTHPLTGWSNRAGQPRQTAQSGGVHARHQFPSSSR